MFRIYQTFFESAHEPAGMADLEGSITYANQALCDLLGRDDLLGTNVREYYSDDDLPTLENMVLPGVLKQGFQLTEIPLQSIDGTLHYVRQSVFRIDDEQGNPKYFANVISDITSHKMEEENLDLLVKERTRDLEEINKKFEQEFIFHKNAEEALRESEAALRSIFRAAPKAALPATKVVRLAWAPTSQGQMSVSLWITCTSSTSMPICSATI